MTEEVPTGASDGRVTGEELDELRSLLIAPEQGQLRELSRRLDDPRKRAVDVSAILPEAIAMRPRGDKQLVTALTPAVSEAVRDTLRRDPRGFADVFFPLLGPAIRKAISKALGDMVQSLNQVVEQTFTPKGLRWRLEAMRTGRPFAEVVLAHSLVYRVEEVFLVHRDTGLLLQHAAAAASVVRDADMASAMLTAIRDFGRDTFDSKEDESVEAFQFSDLNVWIEQGPHALLAAVIRGNAPGELRTTLQEALERIHLENITALTEFAGDTAPFEATRDALEDCLQAQYAAETKQTSPLTWIITAAVALLLVGWALFAYLEARRWRGYQVTLRATPGIVLSGAETTGGRYVVSGLRDPRAADPRQLAVEAGLDPEEVDGRWETYYSGRPEFAIERARELLAPPPGVEMSLDNGVLAARGSAPTRWVEDATRFALLVPGVTSFDVAGVVDPGLESLVTRLQSRTVCFPLGVSALAPDQSELLREMTADVRALDAGARSLGRRVRIELVGYSDRPGTDDLNMRLSRERAESVRSALGVDTLEAVEVVASGGGARGTSGTDIRPQDSDRCVMVRVAMVRGANR